MGSELQKLSVFQLCNSSSGLTWQCNALYLVRLAGVTLQFTFGHRLRLAQMEKGQPVPHRRLLSFSRRPLAVTTQKQILFNNTVRVPVPHTGETLKDDKNKTSGLQLTIIFVTF